MKNTNFHESFQKKAIVKYDSDKKFGYILSFILLILSIFPLIKGQKIRILPGVFSLSLALISLTMPTILGKPKKAWFSLALTVQRVTSSIFLMLLFFLVFCPLSLILKVLGKDLLRIKLNNNQQSYWIHSDKKVTNFREQF